MTSVVIAAHDEAAVIGACLDSLCAGAQPGEFDVTVVANGCSDRTAALAREHGGARVLELAEASKAAALNAGDAVATGFPRIYLDADILVTAAHVRAVSTALTSPAVPGGAVPLAAVPRREVDVRHRPLGVRCYYAINTRLPAFTSGLFGRGMIGLSAEGRDRFGTFPPMIADDLFLDSLFDEAEKHQVDAVSTVVATPRTTADLVRRLVRVRRGNTQLRTAGRNGQLDLDTRPADRLAWLRTVVLPRPWLAPAAVVYVAITALAASRAARVSGPQDWGRDASTREASPEQGR